MTRSEAKLLFKTDVDSYGRTKRTMGKIDQIYDDFEKTSKVNWIRPEADKPKDSEWVFAWCLSEGQMIPLCVQYFKVFNSFYLNDIKQEVIFWTRPIKP